MMHTIKTTRIKIEDLPVYSEPSQEELDLVSGAGRVRLGVEVLESRELMAANLTASLIQDGGLNVLKIEGTQNADTVIVREVNSQISIDNVKIQTSSGLRVNIDARTVDYVFVEGLGGNDTIDLTRISKSAVVDGGAGNDKISGSSGWDALYGGAGNDLINGMAGNDFIAGQAGNDTIKGGDGDDLIKGGAGDDQLWGEAGNDRLLGEDDNDELRGGSGNDILEGGKGDDKLDGGSGTDRIDGQEGENRITGAAQTTNKLGKGDQPSASMAKETISDEAGIPLAFRSAQANSSNLLGDTLPEWVDNSSGRMLKYKVKLVGFIQQGGTKTKVDRWAYIEVLPSISGPTDTGSNPVNIRLDSGAPLGLPQKGAIDFITDTYFNAPLGGGEDVTYTTLKTGENGKQHVTIRPDLLHSAKLPDNVFTKTNERNTPIFYINEGKMSLNFTKNGKVTGNIRLKGSTELVLGVSARYKVRVTQSQLVSW